MAQDTGLPLGPSPIEGGLTVPGPTQGEVREHVYIPPPPQTNETIADGMMNLSAKIGVLADRAAVQEGKVAGGVAGLDPNYRPTPSVTTGGQSFNEASVNSYQQGLQQTSRDSQQAVYEDFKKKPLEEQTPDTLTQMLKAKHDELVSKHLFPEAQPAFEKAWGAGAGNYITQATNDHDTYVKNQSKADTLSNAQSSFDAQQRHAATPGAAGDKAWVDEYKSFAANLDKRVQAGDLTRDQAEKLKDSTFQANMTTALNSRFDALPPEKRQAFVDAFKKDWASDQPDITKGLHAPAYQKILGDFESQLNSDTSKGNQQARVDAADIGTYTQRLTKGLTVSEADNTAVNNKYGGNKDPRVQQALTEYNQTRTAVASLKGKSAAEIQTQIDAEKAEIAKGVATPIQQSVIASEETYQQQVARQEKVQAQQDKDQAMLAKQTSDDKVKYIEGYTKRLGERTVGVEDIDRLNALYKDDPDSATQDALGTLNAASKSVKDMHNQTAAQIQAQIAAERQQFQKTGAGPRSLAVLAQQEKYVEHLQRDLSNDPLGRAVSDDVVQRVNPLAFDGPDLDKQIAARMATAKHVADHYQLKQPTYFTPDETSQLKTIAANGGAPMQKVAASIATAAGPDMENVLSEIGKTAPGVAHMAKLMVMNGGGSEFTRDMALAQKYNTTTEGKALLEKTSPSINLRYAENVYGDAFQNMPDFYAGAVDAAKQRYQVQAIRSPSTLAGGMNVDQDTMEDNLREAAGGRRIGGKWYGGVGDHYSPTTGYKKLPLPPDIQADKFDAILKSVTDQQLQSQTLRPVGGDGERPVTADRIKKGTLVAIAPGQYEVALGDPKSADPQWVLNQHGDKYVLDFNRMQPQLRKAMPNYYRTP